MCSLTYVSIFTFASSQKLEAFLFQRQSIMVEHRHVSIVQNTGPVRMRRREKGIEMAKVVIEGIEERVYRPGGFHHVSF